MYGFKIENFSQNVARLLRRVGFSQKSPAAKNRTTGSAIYRTLKMADKTRQENVTLCFQNAETNILIL